MVYLFHKLKERIDTTTTTATFFYRNRDNLMFFTGTHRIEKHSIIVHGR